MHITSSELKAHSGLFRAIKGKDTRPITHAELQDEKRSRYAQKVLVIWCPWCDTSRKDVDGAYPGLPAFTCRCGAKFHGTRNETM